MCGTGESSTPTTAPTPSSTVPAAPVATVTVPQLVGSNGQFAVDTLGALGLTHVVTASEDADASVVILPHEWTVARIEPAPGTLVEVTRTVVLTMTKAHPPAPTEEQPSRLVKPAPEPTVDDEPVAVEPTRTAPEPESDDEESAVYYKNCTAARAAGAAPVHRGDPGYAGHLDRDGDGVGCEN